MASSHDTLSLDGFRRDRSLPIADVQSANHPEAASAARARIAELSETFPLEKPEKVPALPNEKLVTDREQLRQTLAEEPVIPVKRRVLPSIVQPVLTAVGIFLLLLIVFKSPVLLSQVKYFFHKAPAATSTPAAAAAIVPPDPVITIPKINVSAPVIYEPSTNETVFEKALENGVVHYGNTAVPGQNGNVAIFGHSSNDWWEPGNYKFVFVLLDKLVPGDQITIDYQSVRYTYEVTGSTVVEPTNISVLNQTPTPTLSLITCTPPGTSWKRLVVTAKQIDPDPNKSVAKATPAPVASSGQLSSGSSSIGKQVGGAWHNFVNSIKSLFGAGDKTSPQPTATPANNASSLPAVK